jgi:enamine deaminase RidA (YjgF/YER057c/UK114 family)
MSDRRRAASGSPFEATFGFARAVREGNRILVAGSGPTEPDGSTTPGGAAEQAERCCAIIVAAIEELGGSAADVAWLCRPEWRVEIEAEAVIPG